MQTDIPRLAFPPRRFSGFTLTELLVVMAIASVLMGLLVLGVRGFNGSVNRRAAIGTLMGVFDQARTVAVSEGRPTYVVFVSAPSGNAQNTTGVSPTMWGRAYAVFQDPVLQDSSTSANFVPQQRSNWLYLPTGFAFKADSNAGTTMASLTNSPPASGDITTFKVPASAGGQASLWLPYVKFDSTGQIIDHVSNQVLDPGSSLLRVLLFEGATNNAGTETSYRRNAATTGGNAKYSVDEILLKPTTGRARYTLDPANNLAVSN